jgi:hypothetical protein
MRNFNSWFGNKLADGLSTMFFFWFCFILDIVELVPVIKTHSVVVYVSYLSQTVIQLLALPLLAFQNKLQNDNHKEIMSHIKAQNTHLGIKHVYRRK